MVSGFTLYLYTSDVSYILIYVCIGFTCFVVEIGIFDLKFASSVPVQSGGLSLSDH